MNRLGREDTCSRVLLLHGIWMTGIEMSQLKSRLSDHGFEVDTFRYSSVSLSPIENAQKLEQFIRQRDYACLHMVAHSLGGILLLNLFDLYPDQPPGRVVLLGSPVQGSEVARRLAARPWSRWLIGQAGIRGLVQGAPQWRGKRDLGVIAGTSGMGIGRLLGGLSGESDGTVMVSETNLGPEVMSRTHHTGHMGLLFSAKVVMDVVGFLREGRFPDVQV